MLPAHEPIEPDLWRAAWAEVANGGLVAARVIRVPGRPRAPGPFTGVTDVPFVMVCLSGRIDIRTADGERFAIGPRACCIWAPGTWVACWHVECPRYLRATIAPDHVFAAMKDHDRRRRGGRLVDLYGVSVPGRPDPALRGLLGGITATDWEPPAARAAAELILWSVHAHLGRRPDAGDDHAARIGALAERDPAPSRSAAARELGLAPETVSRLCRKHGGGTWRDLVDAARLRRAELRLLGGEPIESVAAACGFASASHLIRRFRIRHGTTPDRWRRLGAAARARHTGT